MTGKELIKKWEGLRLEAYLDGGGVPTIGWGHTKDVKMGDKITLEQAQQFFDEDYNEAAFAVLANVSVPLNENQLGALICFVYNVGMGAFKKSTLLKLLNEGKYLEASNQLPRWNKDNGQVVTGLTNRRLEEKAVFNTPIQEIIMGCGRKGGKGKK